MQIETADEAVEAYKSLGEWEYADREAAWRWMFEQGRISEREACAKVCEETECPLDSPADDLSFEIGTLACAEAIRARSNAGGERDAR